MPKSSLTPDERFDQKWTTIPETDCHWWTAGLQGPKRMQYGCFVVGGKNVRAHRYAYERSNGPIPEGAHIRHTCDNPLCVNPDHLLVGTNQDNINDKVLRGRQHRAPGESHPMCRLTEEQAISILRSRDTHVTIGRRYGVTPAQVSNIKRGKSWAHLHEHR